MKIEGATGLCGLWALEWAFPRSQRSSGQTDMSKSTRLVKSPKTIKRSLRRDEIEQFLLQTNVAHKFLSRNQVEYKNKLHK